MVKVRAGKFVLLGISAKNVEALMQGKPIVFDADVFGPEFKDFKVAIHYGRTEQAIMDELDIEAPG